MKLSDIAYLNPRRTLKKGTIAPFVEMASLPINARDIEHIGEKEFKSGGSKFRNDDVLFARITPCLENGKTAKVSGLADDEIAFGSTEFIVLTAKNSDDKDYLYYLARLPEFRAYAQARMEGTSGRQRVAWQSLAEFEFNFPKPEQRKRAGDLLKIFDDKIQLNKETNQTLEAIAQALFKSWFIDFDPVRAKAEALANGKTKTQATIEAMKIISGKTTDQLNQLAQENPKDYQRLQTIAEAFPSGFYDTGIPLGWEMKPLSSFGDIVCGKTPFKKKPEYYGDDIPLIKIPDMHNNAFVVKTADNISLLGADSQNKKYIEKGSVCVSCIATVGLVSIASQKSQTNQQINSIKPKKDSYSKYLYLSLSNRTMIKYLQDLASGGSATLNLNTTSFSKIRIVKADDEIIDLFNFKISPLFEQILQNALQNETLQESRDMLLPKLLNGEI